MSFTSENPQYGRNRRIQEDLNVHWVSDEEIMDVVLTDKGSQRPRTAVKKMIFWRIAIRMREGELADSACHGFITAVEGA